MRKRATAILLVLAILCVLLPQIAPLSIAATYSAENRTIPEDTVEFNGHFYSLFMDANSFDEAQQNCISRGGHLATLTSSEENSFVYNYIINQGINSAYFGYTDVDTEGTWRWVTGETSAYSNWHNGEPNAESNREDYAMFYYKFSDGTWNDGDFGGSTVNGGTYYICEWDGSINQRVCLANLECVDEGHYTGNQGDARVYRLDGQPFSGYNPTGYKGSTKRNGNIGLDGTAYQDGFEVWIARWNYGDNISWAYRTFRLGGQYQTLTGNSGIITSYNTTNYDVTVYFYSGSDLLYSFQITPSNYQMSFSIDVSGVDELKVLVMDNKNTAGGTSYALYNLFLDRDDSSSYVLSDEIAHLIFSDMSYHITKDDIKNGPTSVSAFVNAGHGSTSPLYKNSSFSQRDAFMLVANWTIKEVDYGNEASEAAGYAATVFQKGNRIVIAYRGSEGNPLQVFQGKDWTVDAQFAILDYLNQKQFQAALNTYNKYRGEYSITLTGHSLGGALATYVSILTGAKAYTYDGADGHVVDLSYYVGFRSIDFHGIEDMNFVNYTDIPALKNGLSDIIQATHKEFYYGNYYEYNKNHIHPRGYWLVPAHFIYSTTQPTADGQSIELTAIKESYAPKKKWSMTFKNNSNYADPNLSRSARYCTVTLGTKADDHLVGNPSIYMVPKKLKVIKNIMYGGDGADTLVGAIDSNIFIPGRLEGDCLVGNFGSDLYYLDCQDGGDVYISDHLGIDVIQLKNSGSIDLEDIVYLGRVGDWHTYSIGEIINIHIKHTSINHWFSLLVQDDTELCQLSSCGGSVSSGRGGGRKALTSSASMCKNVIINGLATIQVFDKNDELIETFSTAAEIDMFRDYGNIFVTKDDDNNHLYASIYDDYHLEVYGDDKKVDICILGSDNDYYVDHITEAESIDLSKGNAVVTLSEQKIIQNSVVLSSETFASTDVTLNIEQVNLAIGQEYILSANLSHEDVLLEGAVSWQTDSQSAIRCIENTDGSCRVIGLSAGSATVHCISEDSGISATCTVTVEKPNIPFTDVMEGKYYYRPVLWAYLYNPQITSGTSDYTFSPNDTCTRAQIVTFLWRTAGSPEPTTIVSPFEDVTSGKYYYKAVLWAVEAGITSGTSDTTFSPNDSCTRAQVVTFLWRFAGSPETPTIENPFEDVPYDKYYTKAVFWAAVSGVTAGTSDTTFSPNDTCTRGQIVTFLYRTACLTASPQANGCIAHIWSGWERVNDATCTSYGADVRYCSQCGKSEIRYLSTLGHNFINGICDRCGERDQFYEEIISGNCGDKEENLTWQLNATRGILTISGNGAMRNYPSLFNVPWSNYRSKIKTVIICDGVTNIGDESFCGCVYLSTLTIGNTVSRVGKSAFMDCTSLCEISLPESIVCIDEHAFLDCAYYNDTSKWSDNLLYLDHWVLAAKVDIVSATIKPGTIGIANAAFSFCSSLSNISIPDSVAIIGKWAFSYCSSLTSISIPENVTTIGDYVFSQCMSLSEIIISPQNASFCSMNGVLFNKDKTVLIQYPAGRSSNTYTIPNSVVIIDFGAFYWCDKLTEITIPNGALHICENAFFHCTGLNSIVIPESVNQIDAKAFSFCNSLTTIQLCNPACSIYESAYTLGVVDTTTIIGYSGSTAELYASKFGYDFIALQ